MKKIDIYYHVFLTDNPTTFSIFNEQIFLLHSSGLLYSSNSVNICLVHSSQNKKIIDNVEILIKNYNLNNNIHLRYISHSGDECITGNILLEDYKIIDDERYVLYFHTKGASHCGGETEIYTKYWRHFMEHYCIQQWKNCIKKLNKGFESVGVLWFDYEHIILENKEGDGFYAGSFYWISSTVLKKIIKLSGLGHSRYCMEELPSIVKHKYFSFNDSPLENKLDFYKEIFHPKNYIL